MKNRWLHKLFWLLFRGPIRLMMALKFRFMGLPAPDTGPCLVLSNHNTDWDPLLLACSFRRQMYFVASEHIFRWGWKTKLLQLFLDPIPRLKGRAAADTAMTVLRRLRKGGSVCIFAEGNRSWDGVTGPIVPATAKLARVCGVPVVTYRLEGGYLSSPRWCRSAIRRGKMRGSVVRVYQPEELRAMKPDEVLRRLQEDLFEDAWARQRVEKVAYKGRHLAERLETMLCVCPVCGQLGSLRSRGDLLSCVSCGAQWHYTEYGQLEGPSDFETLRDWDQWQTERLLERLEKAGEESVFSDTQIRLREILPRHDSRELGVGELRLFRDRLEWEDMVFPMDELGGISLLQDQTAEFSSSGQSYELDSDSVRCLRKYMTLWENIRSGA